MSRVWLIGLTTALGVLIAYLLFWPVPISPARWMPPEAPMLTGPYEPNEALADVELLKVGLGPESVTVSDAGKVMCGLENGSIVCWLICEGTALL